ncbi:hypothetical protein WICPIJ_002009 [Wickerhamomyces pijperi]|uniref:DNA damage-inducible protein 1 n=1 Tax=Wickerhamomyces pijperi TaxID=599730 RepID=A0A9P8QC85_WICPI|nr:hypothetical protein WICPIJ_002009 [Wickerhamomyces pijperi]
MVSLTALVEHTEQVFSVDLPEDFTFADFKAYLSAECDVQPQDQIIILDNKEIRGTDSATLASLGFKDGTLFHIKDKSLSVTAATAPVTANNTANSFATGSGNSMMNQQFETARQQLLNNPQMQQQLQARDPEMIAALNDPVRFREALTARMSMMQSGLANGGADNSAELARLSQDPDNPENQRRIMELIEQNNIEENMQNALENTPESFTRVDMLYVNVEINGFPIKAFVDSGAQATIISPKLAEKCNLHRLIDKRFRGIAKGVGSGEIIGRVHSAPLKIGGTFIPCSFTVLQTNVDMLLGLDMLRRHQANIDLKNNVLKIADTETPFLSGKDVPNDFGVEQLAQDLGNQVGTSFGGGAAANGADPKRQKVTPPAQAAAQAALNRNNPGSATSTATSSVPQPNEASITQLVGLGFSRAEAISALAQTGGNVDLAASLLFQ